MGVLAIGLVVVAYAFLFHRTPLPRPVDPLLGATLDVEFRADRPWKSVFPAAGASLLVEDYLQVDVVGEPVRGPGTVRMELRIRGRDDQRAEALTLFRTGIYRGTRLRVRDGESEVEVEVLAVRHAGDGQ